MLEEFTDALMSGLLTAHSVSCYSCTLDLLLNRNLIYNLNKLEKK